MSLISNTRVNQVEKDGLFSKGDKNGMYTVRANVALLEGAFGMTVPLKITWNSCVSPKVSFFAWEV